MPDRRDTALFLQGFEGHLSLYLGNDLSTAHHSRYIDWLLDR